MTTVYGYEISPKHDQFVVIAEEVVIKLSEAFLPGAAAVNLLPIRMIYSILLYSLMPIISFCI